MCAAEDAPLTDTAGLLEAHEVSKLIDDQVLLPPASLSVQAGEIFAVLGENGAGKTTLLRILAGQTAASSGSVTLRGEVVDERVRSVRASISPLIGAPALYPDLTVGEQLRLIQATWSVAADAAEVRVDRVLEQFGIGPLRERFLHELSSGQTQLVHLATAFVRPFSVLILDEPEQRLDPGRKRLLVDAVLEVARQGAAVVLTTHDASVVEACAHRTLTLAIA